MADENVKVKRVTLPKSNLSPLLLVGLAHYVCVRVYLFFAPLINRLWNVYQRTLRVLTLPYQGCCTMILLAFLWPFLICIFWFYICIRLWEWYGWPLWEVPPVVTLMGPVDVRQARPAARANAAAPAAALAAALAATTQAETSVVRRRNVAPAQAPALTPAQASASTASPAATPTSTTPSQATAGAKTSETGATAAVASGGAAAAAAPAVKPKRSARDRSPDGWFGPPPPEEGGPEPPYVPYDPNFVDPTDYIPEEELAQYKFYKRRTPYRRVP